MKTLKSFVLLSLIAVFITACGAGGGSDNPGATDTSAPAVSSTSPANGTTGVAMNSSIAATFSKGMDTSTINGTTFTLSGGSGSVSGTVTCNGSTATFTPSSNLSYSTTYTATITTGAKDAAGNAVASNYTWNFTTGNASDTTPPTVSSTNPANNATGVAVNSAITATFSETMDASTITTGTFYVGGVSGTVTYNGTTATFTPSSNLSYDTAYTATVTNGAKDAAGNAVASNYTWSFTTGVAPDTTPPTVSSTSPANNATGVAVNLAITATFSESMDAATITTSTFTLIQGTMPIAGAVTYSGTTATFTPTSSLSYSTTYTATITTGAKDAAGNAMVSNYSWSFTTGTAPWYGTKQLGSSLDDRAYDIATDSIGNVYVVGYASGGLNGSTNAGGGDIVIIKYNPSGVNQWTKQFGTTGDDIAYGIATDNSGSIYVAGYTVGELDGNTNTGGINRFVTKYSSTGVKQWTKQAGTATEDIAYAVTTDTSANIYVAGYTFGNLDGNTNAGSSDVFIVKYDSSGIKQWTKQIGTLSVDVAYGIATDGIGNIYIAGYTSGGLDGNTNAGGTDSFVIKYDSSGMKQWTKQFGTISNDYTNSIATDSCGNTYVAGYTLGGLDGNTNTGGYDLFIVKYDAVGVKQWTKQLGTASNDYANGVVIDSSCNIYVTGRTDGSLDGNTNAAGSGADLLYAPGLADLYVVKYDAAGAKQWTKQLGTVYNDDAKSIAADSFGNLYVAGYTWGGLDGNTNTGGSDIFVVKYNSSGLKQ